MKHVPRTIIESPYAGDTEEEVKRNKEYALRAMRDSIERGEAPFASHVLYAMTGLLDDSIPEQRYSGINMGYNWLIAADQVVFYVDYGMSPGMERAWDVAVDHGIQCSYRKLFDKAAALKAPKL